MQNNLYSVFSSGSDLFFFEGEEQKKNRHLKRNIAIVEVAGQFESSIFYRNKGVLIIFFILLYRVL